MVSTSSERFNSRRFVLQPNRSMSWRTTKTIYVGIVSFSLVIAFGFLWLGYWPILPFAGAELAALGVALYVCGRENERREVVVIDEHRVSVEKGIDRPQRCWEFQRAWTRVTLSRSGDNWYPSQLLLGSHGKWVEVGRFLNEQERLALAGALREAI